MGSMRFEVLSRAARFTLAGVLAASALAFAQDTATSPQDNNGWKRADPQSQQQADQAQNDGQYVDQNGYPQASQPPPPGYSQNPPPPPAYGQQPYGQQPYGQYPQTQAAPPPLPAQLQIQRGAYITVRINQELSSDKNQPGDPFTGTLVDPVVVNGVVIAQPGQTVGGRVAVATHSHMGGTAQLGLQLTNITLADGQVIPLETQFISRAGGTTPAGQEVGTVAATTGIGAAIGAAAGWGTGAAIGAGAGAAAGLIGVMLTHGHASVVYPEQMLTFQVERAATVSTTNAPQAFHYVQPGEYSQPSYSQPGYGPGPGPGYGPGYATAAPPPSSYGYGYPYPYYAYGYPYYWGPSFAFYYGPGYWWGGHYYYGHGYYGGHYYGGRYVGPHGAMVVHGHR